MINVGDRVTISRVGTRWCDIKPSADGWAILHCLAPNGKPFTVSCPGDVTFKRHVLNNKHDYIGKNVTVQFAYWTEDGLPFHCVATAIRDYKQQNNYKSLVVSD